MLVGQWSVAPSGRTRQRTRQIASLGTAPFMPLDLTLKVSLATPPNL